LQAEKRQKSHVVLTEEDWINMRAALVALALTFANDLQHSRPVLTQVRTPTTRTSGNPSCSEDFWVSNAAPHTF
jgi:hypothetical protein